jgi:hypothetical protein
VLCLRISSVACPHRRRWRWAGSAAGWRVAQQSGASQGQPPGGGQAWQRCLQAALAPNRAVPLTRARAPAPPSQLGGNCFSGALPEQWAASRVRPLPPLRSPQVHCAPWLLVFPFQPARADNASALPTLPRRGCRPPSCLSRAMRSPAPPSRPPGWKAGPCRASPCCCWAGTQG